MLALWVKFSANKILKYFTFFPRKQFSRKNKINITSFSSGEFSKRVVKIKKVSYLVLLAMSYEYMYSYYYSKIQSKKV